MKKFWSGIAVVVLVSIGLLSGCKPQAAALSGKPSSQPAATQAPAANIEDAKLVEAAKKEGTVAIYTWGLTGDIGVALSKAFKDKYSITVELTSGPGAQLVPRIQGEYRAGQYTVDLLEGSPINALFAKQQGLTQSLSGLPQMAAKDVWVRNPYLDKDGHLLTFFYTIHGLYINTNLLKPADAPKSWKDLLDPKWKGKMVVEDPDTMPTGNQLYIVMTRHLGFTDDYFRAMAKQEIVIAPSHPEADAMVARGQYPINLASSLSTIAPLIAQGAPVAPIDMAEGVVSPDGSVLSLMSKAPHPNAARLFSDWLMSKEGQDVHDKVRSMPSMRKDVTDYRPAQAKIKYSNLVPMTEQDWNDGAKAQADKVLTGLGWAKK